VINLVSLLSFAWDQIYIREINHAFLNCTHVSLTGDDCVRRFVVLRGIKTTEASERVMLVRNISLSKNFEALSTLYIDLELMICHNLRSREYFDLLQLKIHSACSL
jgi:hypothetical protein